MPTRTNTPPPRTRARPTRRIVGVEGMTLPSRGIAVSAPGTAAVGRRSVGRAPGRTRRVVRPVQPEAPQPPAERGQVPHLDRPPDGDGGEVPAVRAERVGGQVVRVRV